MVTAYAVIKRKPFIAPDPCINRSQCGVLTLTVSFCNSRLTALVEIHCCHAVARLGG